MQGATSAKLHKRNLRKETESIRNARARQLRLDEISGKLERAKHKSIRTSNHQKVEVLKELTSIHRVFEPPLYVIKEDQERLVEDQFAGKQNRTQESGSCASDTTAAFVKQPRLLRRAQTQNVTSQTTQTNTDQGKVITDTNPKSQVNGENNALLRPRSYSWSPQSPNSEPKCTRYAFQSKRDYMAKLRTAAVEPRVSDSMSSLTLGYLAFKRVLKSKRRPERMARSFVNSRFRSMSLDETELSVIPELVEGSDAGAQGTFCTQRSSAFVKEDKKQKRGIIESISAPVGQQQHFSTFSWPLGELTRTQVVLRQKDKKEQEGINKTKKNSKEEENGKFDKNPQQKLRLSQNRQIRFIGTSKLLRPLGTGCFSESFQAISNGKN